MSALPSLFARVERNHPVALGERFSKLVAMSGSFTSRASLATVSALAVGGVFLLGACRGVDESSSQTVPVETDQQTTDGPDEPDADEPRKETSTPTGPKLPSLQAAPEDVSAAVTRVVDALNGGDPEAMEATRMPYDLYATERVQMALANNPKAAKKLGPEFLWVNMSEDSNDDRQRLLQIFKDKEIAVEQVQFGVYEDRGALEMYSDVVVTASVDGADPVALLFVGEVVRDRGDGKVYILRFDRRSKRKPVRTRAEFEAAHPTG